MPGLYAWLRRHPRLVDGALALLLIYPGGGIPKLGIVRMLLLLPFVFGMAIPVAFRRAYPVGAFTVVIAVGALQVLLLRRPAGADLAVLIVLYTLAASRPRRISLRGLGVCLAGAAVAIARWHPARPVEGVYTIGVEAALFGGPTLLAWLLGDSTRWRRGYYQALEDRAARLERERDAQAQVAAAAERARIAREIHDVVAHNVSVTPRPPATRCSTWPRWPGLYPGVEARFHPRAGARAGGGAARSWHERTTGSDRARPT